jgi:hypothetical protein
MTTVHAQVCGDQALLPRAELERLVELARKVEHVEFDLQEDDLPVKGLMLLADKGGAFDWLLDEPDSYSANDCKVRYK